MYFGLKVRQSQNDFFKLMILPKNEQFTFHVSCFLTKFQTFLKLNFKMSFWYLQFLPKTSENKSHSSKVEFVSSIFGRNISLKKSFRLCLTFRILPYSISSHLGHTHFARPHIYPSKCYLDNINRDIICFCWVCLYLSRGQGIEVTEIFVEGVVQNNL